MYELYMYERAVTFIVTPSSDLYLPKFKAEVIMLIYQILKRKTYSHWLLVAQKLLTAKSCTCMHHMCVHALCVETNGIKRRACDWLSFKNKPPTNKKIVHEEFPSGLSVLLSDEESECSSMTTVEYMYVYLPGKYIGCSSMVTSSLELLIVLWKTKTRMPSL